jgi:tetratricopeptide (TPR) repeat protein
MAYMSTGQLEKAEIYFEKYFELAPVVIAFFSRPIGLLIKNQKKDRVEEVLTETEKIHPGHPAVPYGRALMLAINGEKEKALDLYKNSEVYALLGMKDEAFDHLNKEIRGTTFEPYLFYYELLNNPHYKNLRDDPRFDELLEREKQLYDEHLEKYRKI